MDGKRRFVDRLMDTSIQSIQPFPNQSIIEIAGTSRVLIENHCGVKAYGHEQILVQVPHGCICITGQKLELMHMSKEQLVISGLIQCVHLQRKEGI